MKTNLKKGILFTAAAVALTFGVGCENKAEERAEQRAENLQDQNALTPTAPAATAPSAGQGQRVCATGENGTTADGQPCVMPSDRTPASELEVSENPNE